MEREQKKIITTCSFIMCVNSAQIKVYLFIQNVAIEMESSVEIVFK